VPHSGRSQVRRRKRVAICVYCSESGVSSCRHEGLRGKREGVLTRQCIWWNTETTLVCERSSGSPSCGIACPFLSTWTNPRPPVHGSAPITTAPPKPNARMQGPNIRGNNVSQIASASGPPSFSKYSFFRKVTDKFKPGQKSA
jgi:hypothetical protein